MQTLQSRKCGFHLKGMHEQLNSNAPTSPHPILAANCSDAVNGESAIEQTTECHTPTLHEEDGLIPALLLRGRCLIGCTICRRRRGHHVLLGILTKQVANQCSQMRIFCINPVVVGLFPVVLSNRLGMRSPKAAAMCRLTEKKRSRVCSLDRKWYFCAHIPSPSCLRPGMQKGEDDVRDRTLSVRPFLFGQEKN